MAPEFVILFGTITAAVAAVITGTLGYLLQRRKVNAEAIAINAQATSVQDGTIAAVTGRMDIISQQYFDIRDKLADSREAYFALSQRYDELLRKVDGMPQEILDKTAEIFKLKREAAGLPSATITPNAELTALAADIKVAESKVSQPPTGDSALKIEGTVTLKET